MDFGNRVTVFCPGGFEEVEGGFVKGPLETGCYNARMRSMLK